MHVHADRIQLGCGHCSANGASSWIYISSTTRARGWAGCSQAPPASPPESGVSAPTEHMYCCQCAGPLIIEEMTMLRRPWCAKVRTKVYSASEWYRFRAWKESFRCVLWKARHISSTRVTSSTSVVACCIFNKCLSKCSVPTKSSEELVVLVNAMHVHGVLNPGRHPQWPRQGWHLF